MQGPGGIVKGSYDPQQLNQDQRDWLYQQFGHSGGAPVGYGGEHVSGDAGQNFSVGQAGPSGLQQAIAANQAQVQANQPAIQTLQGQETNLSQQYKTLLDSVINQGSVTMNTATSGENAYLGQRGLLSQAGVGNTQLSQAQQGVQAQNQSAAAQVGMGSAQDINALAGQIASLQAGNLPQAENFISNYGQVANQAALIPAQNQLAQAQALAAKYVSIPGYGVYDPSTKQLIGGLNGVPGQGVTNVNGVPSLYVP